MQEYQEWQEWKANYLAEKIRSEAGGSPTKKIRRDHAIGRVCEDYPCCGHDSPSECMRANR